MSHLTTWGPLGPGPAGLALKLNLQNLGPCASSVSWGKVARRPGWMGSRLYHTQRAAPGSHSKWLLFEVKENNRKELKSNLWGREHSVCISVQRATPTLETKWPLSQPTGRRLSCLKAQYLENNSCMHPGLNRDQEASPISNACVSDKPRRDTQPKLTYTH